MVYVFGIVQIIVEWIIRIEESGKNIKWINYIIRGELLMNNDYITEKERNYLRDLAKKQLEYANLPLMKERENLWFKHNSLQAERPPVVMEMKTFFDDMLPDSRCQSRLANEIEKNILFWIINHEQIDDDKVIPDYYTIYWKIDLNEFSGLNLTKKRAESKGKNLGYKQEHPIQDLEKDFHKLSKSSFSVDREYTLNLKAKIEDIIGDILPVKIKNNSLYWYPTPSQKVVSLMGLEQMMYSMVDCPEKVHELYSFLVDDIKSFIKWQEKEGLLILNNRNDFVGSGSYGFSAELPLIEDEEKNRVTLKKLWLNLNSQETVGISPKMFGKFIFPYYQELAQECGLLYYGCCEPVHDIWDNYISNLHNLRKVSISPWCDQTIMGERLENSGVIFSRKPSPNYIGVGSFKEKEFKDHIKETLLSAKNCNLEIIFRDIYTIDGNSNKAGQAIKIVRNLIEKNW